MKPLLVEAQMTGSPSRVKDGSVNLKFRTMREMSNDDFSLMDEYWNKPGWLMFKLDEVTAVEIPTGNTAVVGKKSPSVQLRNALFAKHKHLGGDDKSFTEYYNKAMDGFIQAVTDSIT